MRKVVEVLKYYREIPEQIRMNLCVIQNLEDQFYTPSVTERPDGQPKGSRGIGSVTEKLALAIPEGVSETIKKLYRENEILESVQNIIMGILMGLEYRERKVIEEFYIRKKRWEKIALGFYSIRQCKNIRNEALRHLEESFLKNEQIKKFFDL